MQLEGESSEGLELSTLAQPEASKLEGGSMASWHALLFERVRACVGVWWRMMRVLGCICSWNGVLLKWRRILGIMARAAVQTLQFSYSIHLMVGFHDTARD